MSIAEQLFGVVASTYLVCMAPAIWALAVAVIFWKERSLRGLFLQITTIFTAFGGLLGTGVLLLR